MNDIPEYKRNFSLEVAYEFLRNRGLMSEADSIQSSKDTYGSYTSTLRRAKVVTILDSKGLLQEFIDTHWPSGKTPKGQTRIRFWRTLYHRFMEKEAAGGEEGEEEEQKEEEGATFGESQFENEVELRNYLARNLQKIEQGLRLHEPGGIEFVVDDAGRRIDILAVDRSGQPVVLELKVRRGHERTIGQVLYYQSMVRKRFAAASVRVVIVAHEISPELRAASETLPNVELFEYELSMDLKRVEK